MNKIQLSNSVVPSTDRVFKLKKSNKHSYTNIKTSPKNTGAVKIVLNLLMLNANLHGNPLPRKKKISGFSFIKTSKAPGSEKRDKENKDPSKSFQLTTQKTVNKFYLNKTGLSLPKTSVQKGKEFKTISPKDQREPSNKRSPNIKNTTQFLGHVKGVIKK